MKNLLRFIALVLIVGSAHAQRNLPACIGKDTAKWSNCFGIEAYPSGTKYVGEFINGKPHGQGSFYASNGTISEGIWNDGKLVRSLPIQLASNTNQTVATDTQQPYIPPSVLPACQGSDIKKWNDCFGTHDTSYLKYIGEFKSGTHHGKGVMYIAFLKMVGDFFDGFFTGTGTFTFSNGSKHVGEWKAGERHGLGIEYEANGAVKRSGSWANNILINAFENNPSRFPFNSALEASLLIYANQTVPIADIQSDNSKRDRLNAEVEAERKKRQELEQQLASNKERERITSDLDLERKKRQELEAQLAASVKPNPPQTNAPRRIAHALVIGNAAYTGSGRLDNPVNDANAISQKLRSMGFIVTTVTDANRQRLVQSMAQFRRTAASADISLLYYAGHGVQIFGTNYILPTDVDQTDPAQATIQGVSLNSVVENFLPGKTKLVFLDACRDNALQRTNDRSVSKGLAPISVAEGTLISYATKDGQTAADGVGSKNSPFTQALLEHLNDPQDIAVVLRKVRERVMKITGGKQQPWEYGSLTGGELVLSAIKPK